MSALVYDGQLRLEDNCPEPVPPPGEALLRVQLAGICNTHLEITRGYVGFRGILGHEFVGLVERCEARGLVGQRVVARSTVTAVHALPVWLVNAATSRRRSRGLDWPTGGLPFRPRHAETEGNFGAEEHVSGTERGESYFRCR